MRNFFYGMLAMLLLIAAAAKAQTVLSESLYPQMDEQGIILAARSPSGKPVAIQADETGHVICAERK